MPCCAVAGCTSHSRHSKDSGISFHRFPTEINLRKQWVNACKRADDFCVDNAKICSLHFDKIDFERDLKSELLNTKSRNILKKTSFPSVKLPNSKLETTNKNDSFSLRLKRVENRETKKQINTLLKESSNLESESLPITDPKTPLCDEVNLESTRKIAEEFETLKKEINEANTKIYNLEEKLKSYESVFSKSQQQVILKGKCKSWNSDDVSKAVTLRCISKKAFNYVKDVLKHPLPSVSTIKRRLSHFTIKPGFIDMSLKVMETQANVFTDFEKDVVMCFDEMKVNSDMCYDSVEDKILGPHSTVQVVVVRSMIGKWKQPIYYAFDTPVDKKLLFEAIEKVESTGFHVRAFVSDMGPSNQKLVTNLGIVPGKVTSISNPIAENRKIWAFFDVPHLLKLCRNHLLDQGYKLFSGQIITKEWFSKLIELQSGGDLKFAHKITHSHIILSGTERQNVRKAAELLSGTVATAIEYNFPGNETVVKFIRTVNNGFDVLNSRMPNHPFNKLKSAYGLHIEEQNVALNELFDLCSSMRVMGKTELLPFQKGFLISINSLKGLYEDLKSEGYTYIMAARCNQDILESYFSLVRGLGRFYDHPLPTAVSQRIKALLLGRSAATIVTSGNCQSEDVPTLSVDILNNLESSEEGIEEEAIEPDLDSPEEEQEFVSVVQQDLEENSDCLSSRDEKAMTREETDLIKMLAGYIAYRVKKKQLNTNYVYGHPTKDFPSQNDWLSALSRGALMRPTSEWETTVRKMETDFNTYHGEDNLSKQCKVMKTLIDILQNKYPHIDEFAIVCYVRTRTFMRMKSMNSKKCIKRKRYGNKNTDDGRKKAKKFTKLQ